MVLHPLNYQPQREVTEPKTNSAPPPPALKRRRRDEIVGLLVLEIGAVITLASVLALTRGSDPAITVFVIYFGLLVMNEGRRIFWN